MKTTAPAAPLVPMTTPPPNPLEDLSRLLASDMAETNKLILERMQSEIPLIPQLAGYLIAAGGKRIRPLMTLASTRLFDNDTDRAYRLAAAVEFIHTATLLHDDVVDESNQRRGQASANAVFGNQTSQWWGNIYLNRFDHFVKEELRVPGYIRFVDDFVLFGQEKAQLKAWKEDVSTYLAGLRLLVHPDKTQIYPVEHGVPFLGFRVYPHYRQVLKQNTRRYRRFLRKKLQLRKAGQLSPDSLELALNSWLGHIRFGQARRLEYQIFWYLRRHGVNLFKHPGGSWRVLERQCNRMPFRLPQQEQSYQSE